MADSANTPRRSPSNWRRRVAMMILGFSMALLLAEGMARISGVVRNVGPSFTVHDPVYGKRLKKSFSCVRIAPEFEMTFSTNSLRFRGSEPAETPQNGIVFIGDSFTMGYGVNDGEEFPRLVGEALCERFADAAVPIVNMGLGDNGNGRWLAFLNGEARQFAPELVVLQVCENDYSDNLREGLYRLAEDGSLTAQPVPAISGLRKLANAVESIPGLSYSYLVALGKQVLKGATTEDPQAGSGDAELASAGAAGRGREDALTLALIEAALDTCRERDWPVLVVSVGVEAQRLADLLAVCDARDIELLVVPDKAQRPELYYRVDSHWRASGHRHVAEAITAKIVEDQELFAHLR